MSTDSFTRLGSPNNVVLQEYGTLSNLMGIWSGNKGVNLIAVPDQKGSFKLLVAPYSETINDRYRWKSIYAIAVFSEYNDRLSDQRYTCR
jgi:hypothetical protein